jgi:hypothetical protein
VGVKLGIFSYCTNNDSLRFRSEPEEGKWRNVIEYYIMGSPLIVLCLSQGGTYYEGNNFKTNKTVGHVGILKCVM